MANWYGYLYDEEKRQSYEEDRKLVENENLDDHYLCTDIDRMEKIALQMPLSSINRPSWDRKFLKENGLEEASKAVAKKSFEPAEDLIPMPLDKEIREQIRKDDRSKLIYRGNSAK